MNPDDYQTVQIGVSPFWARKYAREAGRNWDKFYKRNDARFFRDRHWTDDAAHDGFACLSESHCPPASVLEAGCGAGNCALPLLAANASLLVTAFDFAPAAVALAKRRAAELPPAQAARFRAFLWDFCNEPAPGELALPPSAVSRAETGVDVEDTNSATSTGTNIDIDAETGTTNASTNGTSPDSDSRPTGRSATTAAPASPRAAAPPAKAATGYDYVTLVFVLSAVPPDQQAAGLRALAALLRPGGRLLFRDYATGDLAMQRFRSRNRISDDYFVRQDGTLAVFFDERGVRRAMARAGLRARYVRRVHRVVRNRKDRLEMHRVFLQGEFERVEVGEVVEEEVEGEMCDDEADNVRDNSDGARRDGRTPGENGRVVQDVRQPTQTENERPPDADPNTPA